MKRLNKKHLIYLILILAVAIGIFLFLRFNSSTSEYVISTTKVEKGTLSNTITATGTLEATNTVVVGTQVSGVIEKLYVDFNSKVEKGQLIAELDKSTLSSSLLTAEADLDKAKAKMEYQESCLLRNKILYDKGLLAKSEYDLVSYNYKTSKAEVKSAKANLSRSQRNLSYASIYSPIDGVVLNRAVEEGQTVASSMNTPELFTITNDLSSMQVEANVDEADIGMLKLEQRVEFTVDAFSEVTFNGKVSEIRLQPNESSNVITYIAIISVSNADLKLKPGMTASITVYIEEVADVLIIADKATRFTPSKAMMDKYLGDRPSEEQNTSGEKQEKMTKGERPGPPQGGGESLDDSHKMVWVKDGDKIHPVVIEIGIDDGSNMQVISGVEEGDLLVISYGQSEKSASKKTEDEDQSSPFVQEGQGGKGPGGPPR